LILNDLDFENHLKQRIRFLSLNKSNFDSLYYVLFKINKLNKVNSD